MMVGDPKMECRLGQMHLTVSELHGITAMIEIGEEGAADLSNFTKLF